VKDWAKTLVAPETTILSVVHGINEADLQVALVVDDQRRLLGIVTDGDIRRAILRQVSFDKPVSEIMNPAPITCPAGESRERVQATMTAASLRFLPMVDAEGRVVSVCTLENLLASPQRSNTVVLMAGGMGTRLRPLTNDIPKPLLRVGGKPLLEIILEGFIAQGFHNFYLAVNYKAQMIKDYFQDGGAFGVSIRYLEENQRLGTCGALTLLPERPTESLIVMNGDLLTTVDFGTLLDFHDEHGAVATMAVREYDFQVPYGVVETDGHRILRLEEKPIQRFFVNAGIYALSPQVLDRLVPDRYMDITELFQNLLDDNHETAMFPIREYWLDIGRVDDFERANQEVHDILATSRRPQAQNGGGEW